MKPSNIIKLDVQGIEYLLQANRNGTFSTSFLAPEFSYYNEEYAEEMIFPTAESANEWMKNKCMKILDSYCDYGG